MMSVTLRGKKFRVSGTMFALILLGATTYIGIAAVGLYMIHWAILVGAIVLSSSVTIDGERYGLMSERIAKPVAAIAMIIGFIFFWWSISTT